MRRRLLVVADETVASDSLRETIGAHAGDGADVLVIGHDRRARRQAGTRLAFCLRSLAAAGIEAEGFVADADPLLAIEDALRLFDADRIVISTRPDGRSHSLARDLIDRARQRFAQPVEFVAA